MRVILAALSAFIFAACAPSPQSSPSPQRIPAFAVMEEGFRAEFIAAARAVPAGLSFSERIPWLAGVAAPIAARHYTDWSVVRAETARRLALLEMVDLSPYAARAPTQTLAALGPDNDMVETLLGGAPARRAALRNFDPSTIAIRFAYAILPQVVEESESFSDFNFKLQFAPIQVRSGVLNGRTALAAIAGDWLVIVPYTLDQSGMIDVAYIDIAAYDNGPPRPPAAPVTAEAPALENGAPAAEAATEEVTP